MSNIGIIFAGGSGARMGSGIPKQFLEINGVPIIIHTLNIFEEHNEIDKIYISCREDYIKKLNKMVSRFQLEKVEKIVEGGETGQDSIYNAIKVAYQENSKDSIVLIHDGVRPCIDGDIISENIKAVKSKGTAVTCTKLLETPMISKDGISADEIPRRDYFYTAQAPQSFYLGDVYKAHVKMRDKNPNYEGIIDTCTLMKNAGWEINIVKGPRGNIKVTTPEDMYIFRAMLQYKETEMVFGFDPNEVQNKLKK